MAAGRGRGRGAMRGPRGCTAACPEALTARASGRSDRWTPASPLSWHQGPGPSLDDVGDPVDRAEAAAVLGGQRLVLARDVVHRADGRGLAVVLLHDVHVDGALEGLGAQVGALLVERVGLDGGV